MLRGALLTNSIERKTLVGIRPVFSLNSNAMAGPLEDLPERAFMSGALISSRRRRSLKRAGIVSLAQWHRASRRQR